MSRKTAMDRAFLAKAQQHAKAQLLPETMDRSTEEDNRRFFSAVRKNMSKAQGQQISPSPEQMAQLEQMAKARDFRLKSQQPLIDMPMTAHRSLNMAQRQAELIRIRDGDGYKDDYKIIHGTSIVDCETKVKEYLDKGYQPSGGINFLETVNKAGGGMHTHYIQAVYRKAFKTRTSETSLLDTNEPSLIDLSPTTSAGGGKKHKTTRHNKTKKRH